jgi:hypothetical protein
MWNTSSHANVHSQDRPHFCPVDGCPRGVGGKGFKRKNEMMRHGLVHNSPGYVCPFCPDQQHKYPRPDNLQRCVTLIRLWRRDIGICTNYLRTDTYESTTSIKTKTTQSSDKSSHNGPSAVHEADGGECIHKLFSIFLLATFVYLQAISSERNCNYAYFIALFYSFAKLFNLTRDDFPTSDTSLRPVQLFSFLSLFPILVPFKLQLQSFFDDTTCQVRSMMIHRPFVICLLSLDCAKQHVFGDGPLVSPILCPIFFPFSIFVSTFGPWSQKAHNR